MDTPSAPSRYPRYFLPSISRLLPAFERSDAAEVEERSNRWLREHLREAFPAPEVLEEFIARRQAAWPPLFAATARADRLQDMCNWWHYFFAADDHTDHMGHNEVKDLLAVLDGAQPRSGHIWGQGLRTVLDALEGAMAPALFRRFHHLVKRDLEVHAQEYQIRTRATRVDFDAYMRARYHVSGGYWCLALLEHGLGIDLGPQFEAHPELGRINHLALDQLIMANDAVSYRKEYFAQDHMNAVSLLQHEYGLGLQEALDKVCGIAAQREADVTNECDRLLTGPLGGNPDVTAYLQALPHAMAGNLQWSFLTGRYHGPNHHWNGLTSGWIELRPDRTVITPEPGRDQELPDE